MTSERIWRCGFCWRCRETVSLAQSAQEFWQFALWVATSLGVPPSLVLWHPDLRVEPLPSLDALLHWLRETRFTVDVRGDGSAVLEGGQPAVLLAGSDAKRDPGGAPLRFDVSLGARGENGPLGPPSDSVVVRISSRVLASDVASSLAPLFRRGVAAFRPFFGLVNLHDVIAPYNRDLGLFCEATVGWLTYLESGEFPAVPRQLEGMAVEEFTHGTLLELVSRPWDPDNGRLTSQIVATYDALKLAGVLVPPRHVRDAMRLDDEDDEDDEA